MTHMCGSA